ncbi:MAG: hydroxymethylbilane synthase [Methyloligellaceae bacterium]
MYVSNSILRIGTRGSPLALMQAEETARRLIAAHELDEKQIKIVKIQTSGDRIADESLREFGGKGLFTKEIEIALMNEEIDLAVHSMKDVPTVLPDPLLIAAVLPREDVRDAFISRRYKSFSEMPSGAVVGTSSLRRQAQLRRMRPDLKVIEFRGNVQTRLKKLDSKVADATLLACAGLNRLGMENEISAPLETDEMLPAVAQGAIGIEIKSGDHRIHDIVTTLNDEETEIRIQIERDFLRILDGSCRTPIAGLAELDSDKIRFRGQILLPDGTECHDVDMEGDMDQAAEIGIRAGEQLLQQAGPEFLKAMN